MGLLLTQICFLNFISLFQVEGLEDLAYRVHRRYLSGSTKDQGSPAASALGPVPKCSPFPLSLYLSAPPLATSIRSGFFP
jgi:hypothetical protein